MAAVAPRAAHTATGFSSYMLDSPVEPIMLDTWATPTHRGDQQVSCLCLPHTPLLTAMHAPFPSQCSIMQAQENGAAPSLTTPCNE